jgi:hypothetical protein
MRGLALRVARRLGLVDRLRAAWMHDIRSEVKVVRDGLRKDVARLTDHVDDLRRELDDLSGRLSVVAERERQRFIEDTIARLDEKQQDLVAKLPTVLEATRVVNHVREAIARAVVHEDPCPYMVVDDVLPRDVYGMVLKSIPPSDFFTSADPIKQNLRVPFEFGPRLSTEVWRFVDETLAHRTIVPAVTARFSLQVSRHLETLFGPDGAARVAALPQSPSGGRLMLRRPGYKLPPHRDPKRTMLTCLLYLARPGDDESYGTELYRVDGDPESAYTQTYYPEEDGHRCELVRRVPYRPNSMLVFLNGRGAHGAQIPPTAPADLTRFAYQFYVGPSASDLAPVLEDLPPGIRERWQDKTLTRRPLADVQA